MSATKRILAAAVLVVSFSSGLAGAAPHPQVPGNENSGHENIVDAAKRVYIDQQGSRKVVTGVI